MLPRSMRVDTLMCNGSSFASVWFKIFSKIITASLEIFFRPWNWVKKHPATFNSGLYVCTVRIRFKEIATPVKESPSHFVGIYTSSDATNALIFNRLIDGSGVNDDQIIFPADFFQLSFQLELLRCSDICLQAFFRFRQCWQLGMMSRLSYFVCLI